MNPQKNRIRNILLVYPKIPENTYWSFHYSLKFIKRKTALPPLSLITVAAIIPSDYNLKLVDMNFEKVGENDLNWADAVFISAMTVQKESMNEIIEMTKKAGKTSVLGGPYAETAHEKFCNADHYIIGEAEDILKDFLLDLNSGHAEKVYRCKEKPEMKSSVIPRFDLLKMKKYASMSVQYSRGCPFKCEFCDIWVTYGNRSRLKSRENFLKELEYLHSLKWRGSVFLVDDNFIGNKKRLKIELLPDLIKWQEEKGWPFSFYTEASINMADDDELMEMMARAKINQVFIGIETPSSEALEETGKNQNLKVDLKKAVKKIQRYGIEVTAGFILGFDSDKEDIFQRQVEFIQETAIPKAMIGLLQALPGTKLHERLEKEGRLTKEASGSNTHSLSTNFKTNMDPETLKQGYNYVLSTIYDKRMKNYFERCDHLLKNLKSTSYSQRKIGFHEIRALMLSLAVQPFTSYGFEYLKFMTRSLFKNRNLFAEAVTHAVMGHHFHMITKQMIKAESISKKLEDIYQDLLADLSSLRESIIKSVNVQHLASKEIFSKYSEKMKKIKASINRIPCDLRKDIQDKYLEVYSKIEALLLKESPLSFNGRK